MYYINDVTLDTHEVLPGMKLGDIGMALNPVLV